MLQPPAGLHCTAAHYRTRRNLFRVASTGQTTHTYAPTRTFYSPAFRSVGSSFKLRSPSLDRDPILELKTMMIAIVAIYGVALTTRFAEGDDVDVVADTRFFPPRRGAFLAVSCPSAPPFKTRVPTSFLLLHVVSYQSPTVCRESM